MRKLLPLAALCIALAVSGRRANADPVMFMHGWSSNTNLYSVDVATGTETFIGNSGLSNVGGLTFSGSGALYGITTNGGLYTFNTTTGAATLVGNTGISFPEGITFGLDGTTLYVSGGSTIHTVDSNTGAVLTSNPLGIGDVDGLTVAPSEINTIAGMFPAGTLFTTDTNTIRAIDPNTFAVTTLGTGNANEAIAFTADGRLFGHNFSNALFEIDPLTLNGTLVANTSGPITGLASQLEQQAVPEPASIAVWSLLLLTGVAVVWMRRRRAVPVLN